MALGFLQKKRLVAIGPDPVRRAKIVRLTSKGLEARDACRKRIAAIEKRWREHYGNDIIESLRTTLEQITGPDSPTSPLFRGLEPYSDNWRASVPRPATLPHYPMVLHRGGYPDGS